MDENTATLTFTESQLWLLVSALDDTSAKYGRWKDQNGHFDPALSNAHAAYQQLRHDILRIASSMCKDDCD